MAQSIQEHANRNIDRFCEQMKTETDICERKWLEGLIVLEKIKTAPGAASLEALAPLRWR